MPFNTLSPARTMVTRISHRSRVPCGTATTDPILPASLCFDDRPRCIKKEDTPSTGLGLSRARSRGRRHYSGQHHLSRFRTEAREKIWLFIVIPIILAFVACNQVEKEATPLRMAKAGLRHIQADLVRALSPESWTVEENADRVEHCTISINGISRSGIYMQAPGVCRFDLFVHRGAVFTTWVAMTPKAWIGSSDGALFSITAFSTDPPETVLLCHLRLDPMNIPMHRDWFRLDESLAPWTGKMITLELRSTSGDEEDSFQDWCVWGEPTVHSPPLSVGLGNLESVSEEIHLGQQRLDLSFAATRALGADATPAHLAQPLMTTSLEFSGLKREGLYAHPPWTVSRLVTIGPRPNIVTSLGLIEKCWASSNGVDFRIEIKRPGVPSFVLFEYWLCPQVNACDRGWVDVAIDLSRFVGETVRITLTTKGGYRGNLTCDSAAWADPIVVSAP